jgi:hypothetical protein
VLELFNLKLPSGLDREPLIFLEVKPLPDFPAPRVGACGLERSKPVPGRVKEADVDPLTLASGLGRSVEAVGLRLKPPAPEP